MKTIKKKELQTLLSHIDDKDVKSKIVKFIESSEEIPIEDFFQEIKELEKIDSIDYKLLLLLEEFYLRFKDVEEKNG